MPTTPLTGWEGKMSLREFSASYATVWRGSCCGRRVQAGAAKNALRGASAGFWTHSSQCLSGQTHLATKQSQAKASLTHPPWEERNSLSWDGDGRMEKWALGAVSLPFCH